MNAIRTWTAFGYALISIIICIIGYIWHYEWKELERLEIKNQEINTFRQSIHEVHMYMIELSLLGETILEWDDEDLGYYHVQRLAMDSMLCRFKATYPAERIDSVRHLLEDKERQMHRIVRVFEQQQVINDKITRQVPVIVQKNQFRIKTGLHIPSI